MGYVCAEFMSPVLVPVPIIDTKQILFPTRGGAPCLSTLRGDIPETGNTSTQLLGPVLEDKYGEYMDTKRMVLVRSPTVGFCP